MEATLSVCPKCQTPIRPDFYFCPNCGNQLKPKEITVSLTTQILVYLLSFFLAPFGLYPAYKYIRQKNKKTRIIGWVAVILTILSFTMTIILASSFMQQYLIMLNQLTGGSFSICIQGTC